MRHFESNHREINITFLLSLIRKERFQTFERADRKVSADRRYKQILEFASADTVSHHSLLIIVPSDIGRNLRHLALFSAI